MSDTAHAQGGRSAEEIAFSENLPIRNSFLDPGVNGNDTVVVVLNWTLPACSSTLLRAALLRVAADGGCNQLFDELPKRQPGASADKIRSDHLPHVIVGDLDSARKEVLSFYSSHGSEVVNMAEDQDSTDLGKCLKYVQNRYVKQHLQRLTIVVLGAMGGRIDHAIANLNALASHSHLKVVLVGDKSTARLLPAGHSIILPVAGVEGPTCSLVPLLGPCVATTKGLAWNLKDTKMQFGGLVSTSNKLDADIVHVHCDQPLMWTTEFDDK